MFIDNMFNIAVIYDNSFGTHSFEYKSKFVKIYIIYFDVKPIPSGLMNLLTLKMSHMC